MSNKNPNTRRKLLIGIGSTVLGASQLPKSWSKPIVNAVILPTHAQTTETDSSPTPTLPTSFSGTLTFPGVVNNKENKLLSILIPEALAGGYAPRSGEMCITIDSPGGSNFTAQVLLSDGQFIEDAFEGSGTINGGPVVLNYSGGCQIASPPSLEVTSVAASGATYSLNASGQIAAGVLPEGTACPDDAFCDL